MIHLDDLLPIPLTDTLDIADAHNWLHVTMPNLCNEVSDSRHKWVMGMTDRGCCPQWKSDHVTFRVVLT